VLLALYSWEARRGRLDPDSDASMLDSSETEPRQTEPREPGS